MLGMEKYKFNFLHLSERAGLRKELYTLTVIIILKHKMLKKLSVVFALFVSPNVLIYGSIFQIQSIYATLLTSYLLLIMINERYLISSQIYYTYKLKFIICINYFLSQNEQSSGPYGITAKFINYNGMSSDTINLV